MHEYTDVIFIYFGIYICSNPTRYRTRSLSMRTMPYMWVWTCTLLRIWYPLLEAERVLQSLFVLPFLYVICNTCISSEQPPLIPSWFFSFYGENHLSIHVHHTVFFFFLYTRRCIYELMCFLGGELVLQSFSVLPVPYEMCRIYMFTCSHHFY